MTEQESMVLFRFDSEYFKTGRIFMVDEWDVRMPMERYGKGEYEQIQIRRSYLAMVTGLECGGTLLNMMQICQETGGIREFSIQESLYRHGYYGLTPVKIEKERKNDDG